MGLIGPKLILAVLGVLLLLYLFHCYCCMLICRKTGKPPGVLVWLPVLQLFPLLRAAGMSAWWFLACFVPVLNLVPADSLAAEDCQSARQERLGRGSAAPAGHQPVCFPILGLLRRRVWTRGRRPRAESHVSADGLT